MEFSAKLSLLNIILTFVLLAILYAHSRYSERKLEKKYSNVITTEFIEDWNRIQNEK